MNFLRVIYAESITDTANIVVAEAEGHKEALLKYLQTVRDYVDKLIGKLQ